MSIMHPQGRRMLSIDQLPSERPLNNDLQASYRVSFYNTVEQKTSTSAQGIAKLSNSGRMYQSRQTHPHGISSPFQN